MSKMINPKYEGDKIAYLDNDFIRKSTALQPMTELEINLLIYMCYKAKENVDLETGKGWTDVIEIDMKKFLAGIGRKDKLLLTRLSKKVERPGITLQILLICQVLKL